MLRGMTARLFMEWVQFYAIDPWGEQRADLRNALLAMLVANALKGKGDTVKMEDFMLFPTEPRGTKRQSDEQMMTLLKSLCRT